MTRVWEDSPRSGNDLIVLLALADWANDDGYCWPSIPTLATKARLSERTVQRVITKLQSERDIEVHEGGFISGKNRTNTYRVLDPPRQADTPSDLSPPPVSPPVTTPGVTGDTPLEPSVGNRQGEPSENSTAATSAADGEPQLFEAPPAAPQPPTAKAADPLDALVQRVWDHWVQVFGDRLRVKELTPPRAKSIRGGLKAMGVETDPENAVEMCCRAISGLKSYRQDHPDGNQSVSVSDVFETGPHTKHNRTDWISRWADYAKETVPVPGAVVRVPLDLVGVPSVTKGTILARRREVARMYDHPGSAEAKERGEVAVDWLKEHVGHQPKVIDGELRGWELIA